MKLSKRAEIFVFISTCESKHRMCRPLRLYQFRSCSELRGCAVEEFKRARIEFVDEQNV